MRIHIYSTRYFLCAVIALVHIIYGGFVFAQSYDLGYPDIRNFSAKEYGAKPQNWAVSQDKRGIIYVGNNDGVLEYDGKSWRKILTEKENIVRSLAVSPEGKIYVGGTGEFGFLEADKKGKTKFVSLSKRLSEKDAEFTDVWRTNIDSKGKVYFQTATGIFICEDTIIKVIRPENNFHNSYLVNDKLYVLELGKGLMCVENDQLKFVEGTEEFAGDRIYTLRPYRGNKLMLLTRQKGFFILSPKGKGFGIEKFTTTNDSLLIKNAVYNCLQLNDNLFSIGTLGAGVILMDAGGQIVRHYKKETGLLDETIYHQFIDEQKNLWLATNKGLSRVGVNSPITFFNDRLGLDGTVQSVAEFDNAVFAATNRGVYRMLVPDAKSRADGNYQSYFEKLPGITTEYYGLLTFSNNGYSSLLMASISGVFEYRNGKINLISPQTFNCNTLYHSRFDANRVYVGLTGGVASLYFKNGRWENDWIYEMPKNDDIISIVEEGKNVLWMGCNGSGLIRIKLKLDDSKITDQQLLHSEEKENNPLNLCYTSIINNKVVFATAHGLYSVVATKNANGKTIEEVYDIRPDDFCNKKFASTQTGIHRFYQDTYKNVWAITYENDEKKKELAQTEDIEIGFIKNSDYNVCSVLTVPFRPIDKEIIHSILAGKNNVFWLGGPDGLYRFDATITKNYIKPYNTLIRQVSYGKDLLFSGSFYDEKGIPTLTQNDEFKLNLKYGRQAIEFRFAAPFYENESDVEYSYILEGYDDHWSAWGPDNKFPYTNLHEGTYRFRVKAKNIYGFESRESVYEFTVLPPWYKTIWAYIAYVILSISVVYGIVQFTTRGLRNIIRKQTAEVVAQKQEIELKNKDITDSINYAKRIQEAILPSNELVNRLFPKSFILFRPKDIVSGDFYWVGEKEGKAYITAVDCTGHGVPGAFMSMIGNSLLNEILSSTQYTAPHEILGAMREGVVKALKQTGKEGEQKDGMDISFCAFDFKNNVLEWSGAFNQLFLIRNGELIEYKANKFPIGFVGLNPAPFSNNIIQLQPGDTFYFFTDGYADQFGGPDGKKFMIKRFKQICLEIQSLPMNEQKHHFEKTIIDWMGEHEQVDDVLVIGVRV